jgi:antitoxin component YwqK of YwqJK toxin-antitoxin module
LTGLALRSVSQVGRRELGSLWFTDRIRQHGKEVLAASTASWLIASIGFLLQIPEMGWRPAFAQCVVLFLAHIWPLAVAGAVTFWRWPQLVWPAAGAVLGLGMLRLSPLLLIVLLLPFAPQSSMRIVLALEGWRLLWSVLVVGTAVYLSQSILRTLQDYREFVPKDGQATPRRRRACELVGSAGSAVHAVVLFLIGFVPLAMQLASNAQPVETTSLGSEAAAVNEGAGKSSEKTAAEQSKSVEATITQEMRWPNGRLQAQREVIRNASGDFIPHGRATSWHENGQMKWQGSYQNGMQVGTWKQWYESGQQEGEGDCREDGTAFEVHWHLNGQKKSEGGGKYLKEHRRWGKHDKWTTWNEHGQKAEMHFRDNELHGKITMWHPNGQKKIDAEYVNGKMHGLTTTWDPDGNIVAEEYYIDGVLTKTK